MNDNTLEKMVNNLQLEGHPGQTIHGSLIDYVVNAFNREYFFLYRTNVKERDVLYIHGVPGNGAKKYIITELSPNENVYAIARKLDINIITEKSLSPNIFGFKEETSKEKTSKEKTRSKRSNIIEVADKLINMKPETRLFLILTSGWREALIIFCVGFISAFFLSEYLLPFVKSVLKS